MPMPKAYEPCDGYRFQIFCRKYSREWEHCDYATDIPDKRHLLENYRLAYPGFEFKTVTMPMRCWPPQPKRVLVPGGGVRWESTAVATKPEVEKILNDLNKQAETPA